MAVKGEALVKAAGQGNINEVTKLLGKKADINYVDKWIFNGYERASTPLMAAVEGGHAEVVKFLITRKANVNLAEPLDGLTALHQASSLGSVATMELLMSKGAKHDVRDKFGYVFSLINQLPKTGISSPINKVVLTQYLIN
jgi:ankyrin repeat protein